MKWAFIAYEVHFQFLITKSFNIFSIHSMVLNDCIKQKKRQEHNDIALI